MNNKQRKSFQNLYTFNIYSFSIISNGVKSDKNSISEEAQKIINEMKNELQIKTENYEKLNNEINMYINGENQLKEEISKLNIEITNSKNNEIKLKKDISDYKENISKFQKENETLKEQKNEENKNVQKTIEIQNQNIEKYKKLIAYQEEEIKSLKNNTDMNSIIKEDLNKEINDIISSGGNSINMTKDNDKKNKQRNNINQLQIEQDKMVLKYELLKNDYEKLNSSLQKKQKLLDNYSLLTNEANSKKNLDEQILELVSQHKKEIDNLTKKYNQNIINLKMNLPISYSPNTHCILIDKSYPKYNLRWFLLTIITAEEKDYENTFWVSEQEIKPMLDQFNNFRTEKELEQEHFESIYVTQQKWIKQIDENERLISKLKAQLQKYENSSSS
jgi:chromosome segregation ATPase